MTVDDNRWVWTTVSVYCVSLLFFHATEYAFTRRFSPQLLSASSWLCTRPYVLCVAVGVCELVVKLIVWPQFQRDAWPAAVVGVVGIIVGHVFRVAARVHGGRNFTHRIIRHVGENELQTHGIYAVVRHPGYFGFYVWAVATQVLLGNIATTLLFAGVLSMWFSKRIAYEEGLLVKFYGSEYRAYRRRVRVCMPVCLGTSRDNDDDSDRDDGDVVTTRTTDDAEMTPPKQRLLAVDDDGNDSHCDGSDDGRDEQQQQQQPLRQKPLSSVGSSSSVTTICVVAKDDAAVASPGTEHQE